MDSGRILAWFSCGAASAVAAKVAIARYGKERPVEVCYCNTSADEHPDNLRFRLDVEQWIGQPIKVLSNPKYRTVEEVYRAEKFIVGPFGAICTRRMKREVRERYQQPDDTHVFGLTYDEAKRRADFATYHPDLKCLWLLAAARVTKEDCYHVLTTAKIELPAMYRLGYNNNNCIGCVKGGMGYWNKIRRDFPEVFASRAKVQRELGVGFGSGDKDRAFFLDELDPDAGRDVKEPPIECGIFCDHYTKLVELSVNGCLE
jgi:hypothetical protein